MRDIGKIGNIVKIAMTEEIMTVMKEVAAASVATTALRDESTALRATQPVPNPAKNIPIPNISPAPSSGEYRWEPAEALLVRARRTARGCASGAPVEGMSVNPLPRVCHSAPRRVPQSSPLLDEPLMRSETRTASTRLLGSGR